MRLSLPSIPSCTAGALLLLAACYSADYGPGGPGHRLQAVSGNGQTIAPQDTSAELVVVLEDQYGEAVPGQTVTWNVASGGGSVLLATTVTGADGTARTRYVAGAGPDTAQVVAHLAPGASVSFTIRVTAGAAPAPMRILEWFGDGHIAIPSDTTIPFQARVESTDGLSTSVPGVVVTWDVISGPGRMVVVNDTTDGVGISRARYLATADTGMRTVVARLAGTGDSAVFRIRVLPPCPIGPVAVGAIIDSALVGGLHCNQANFDLAVDSGQAYFLTYAHRPDPAQGMIDGVDPLLALWEAVPGKPVQFGRDPLVGFSDEEGGDFNAELFFVAPRSRDLRLQLFTFGGAQSRGGYQLKVEACPVLAVTADPGTAAYTLPAVAAGTCLRHHDGVTSAYRFLSLPLRSGEAITLTVASTDFVPVWDAFPNWGSFGPGGGEVGTSIGSGITRTITAFEDGLLTIAIGGNAPAAAGTFTLTVARAAGGTPPPPRPAAPDLLPR